MDRILVTGGAGFIGSHLCEQLLREGKQVALVDNLDDFYDPRLKLANLEEIKLSGRVESFIVDIRDRGRLEEVFEKYRPQAVVHLAARAGVRPSLIHPELYVSTNVSGTLNLLELSRHFGIEKFIFGSSSSVYGDTSRVPFSEDDPIARPISVYAATKVAGESLAYTYSHLYNLAVICVRIFTAFGPRQRPDLAIRKFAHLMEKGEEVRIFGDGSMSRDYTFVSDVVTGLDLALNSDHKFEVFNIGNSRPLCVSYVVKVLEEALGKKARIKYLPPQPGDVALTYANLDKSRKLLGYEPRVTFEEGIRQFVQWLRKALKVPA
jgi:UDP-glucuronate 4-epimerase